MKKGFIDFYFIGDIVVSIIVLWILFGIFKTSFMPMFMNIIDTSTPNYNWIIFMITLFPTAIFFAVVYGITQRFKAGGYY